MSEVSVTSSAGERRKGSRVHAALAMGLLVCMASPARAQTDAADTTLPANDAAVTTEDGDKAPAVDETVDVSGQRIRLVTPLPGVVLDDAQLSTNAQTADAERIRESGAINTTQFLNEQLQSITVADNTANPFQQDVVFRGFSASPQIGTPQGLSVYLDGARVIATVATVLVAESSPCSSCSS